MNSWAFFTGLLLGWILGVWQSYRRVRRDQADPKKLLDLVRQHRELRELIEKEDRDANVVDFPGNGETKH